MNVTAIRQGLGANLAATYASLDFQIKSFALSAPTPPGSQMLFDRVDFHQELQSGELLRFIVLVTVCYADDVNAQQKLDALFNDRGNVSDPLSVREALESDQALTSRLLDDGSIVNGQPSVAQDVTVQFAQAYRMYTMQGGQSLMLGAEWTVEVLT